MGTDHAPTPWRYHLSRRGARDITLKRDHWELGGADKTGVGLIFGNDEMNAAYIVRCVNSHEALVEALTYLLNETEGYIKINNLSALHNHSLEMARKALAQADEKGAAHVD